jgi:hypothetical protein
MSRVPRRRNFPHRRRRCEVSRWDGEDADFGY